MNLVLVTNNIKDPELWRLALGISTENTIPFNYTNLLEGFAQIALKIDQRRFIDGQTIDWVLYCNNEKGIMWDQFLAKAPHVDPRSDSLYLTQTIQNPRSQGPRNQIPDLLGNFYCRPHVFALLGSLYKLNIYDTNIMKETRSGPLETVMTYAITRAGYDIQLLQ